MSTQTNSSQAKPLNDQRPAAWPRTNAEPSLNPPVDLARYLRAYASQRPDLVALCCFSLGLIIGWRLKP